MNRPQLKNMLIYTTKTALGRSIDRSDDTIHRMYKKGEVVDVFLVNSHGKKKKVGYILANMIVDNAVNIVQKEDQDINKRTSIRTRFRILERDKFTCQYCGNKAPDVILHVDHKIPFSKGGTSEDKNLITACAKCNLGKSNLYTT